MNIYIASAFGNRNMVRGYMELLTAAGHTITHDWTQDSDTGMSGLQKTAYLRDCAVKDLKAIDDADAFVLIDQPDCRGAYTELGYALAGRVPVFANVESTEQAARGCQCFLYAPEIHFWKTIYQLKRALSELEQSDDYQI